MSKWFLLKELPFNFNSPSSLKCLHSEQFKFQTKMIKCIKFTRFLIRSFYI